MQTLVIYDVVEAALRNRVIEVLEDYGLTRIQYSAFLGELNFNRREEMCQRLEDTIADGAARVHVVTLCDRDYRLIRELIGQLSWQMEVTGRTLTPRCAQARPAGGRPRRAGAGAGANAEPGTEDAGPANGTPAGADHDGE